MLYWNFRGQALSRLGFGTMRLPVLLRRLPPGPGYPGAAAAG